jgi:anthranilate/para-aminobenzoate synthase component I
MLIKHRYDHLIHVFTYVHDDHSSDYDHIKHSCQEDLMKKKQIVKKGKLDVHFHLMLTEVMRNDLEEISWKRRTNVNQLIRDTLSEMIEKDRKK